MAGRGSRTSRPLLLLTDKNSGGHSDHGLALRRASKLQQSRLWGRASHIPSSLSPERDCSPKSVVSHLSEVNTECKHSLYRGGGELTRRSDHCCSHRPLLAVVGGRLPKRCPSCCKCEESYGTSLRGLPQSFDASIALGWAIDRYFSPCHDPLPPPVLPVGAHAQTVDSAPEPTIVPRAVLYRLGSSKDGRKEQDRHTHIQAGVPAAKKYPAPHLPLSRPRQLGRGGGVHVMHGQILVV